MNLEADHAFVTGGSRGIGLAITSALAAAGARVTLAGRTAEEVAAAAHGIGKSARGIVLDVRDARALADAIADAERVQNLTMLVNCAGVNRPGRLDVVSEDDVDLVLDTNVRGTLNACRAWARVVASRKRPAAVVNLSSQMGSVGYPGRAAYCASKHAVNGLTKALALEWAPHIRVNAVAPTFVETPLTAPMLAEEGFRDEVLSRIPLGRLVTVDEVSEAVLFLLSDRARMVTGHILAVDGGWTVI